MSNAPRASRTMNCCQVAISSMDLGRSALWYQRALGFVPAGERRHREGPAWAAVPGLPEASFDVLCLVGRQRLFQIEMFEFDRPRMRALAGDRRPCDVGYSMIGIHVPSFDAALARIERIGGVFLSAPLGRQGSRRVCLKDPDGILLELMEDDPVDGRGAQWDDLPDSPRIVSITVSVAGLRDIRKFGVDVLGCAETHGVQLHGPEHEALWGLEHSERETLVLRSGDVLLEFVRYLTPQGRNRPPGYLLSDQGILNIALGSLDRRDFDESYARAVANGFLGNTDPWHVPGVATVVYLNGPQGLSVELLQMEPGALERIGFVPNRAPLPPPKSVAGPAGSAVGGGDLSLSA